MEAWVIRATRLVVPGADLGPEGRLCHLEPIRVLPDPRPAGPLPPDMVERMRRGRPATELPHARLSDYDRSERPRALDAVELSNDEVTATVLPGLGGRVWSLLDHATGRELLHRTPVLRFANLGLSDAWFAGGIEWNLGSTGHTCLTTRPMHAAVVRAGDGEVLRLWEWERTRDLVLQVDLSLDGRRLIASTRVVNPDPTDKPLYYWTNIAVPETPSTRVVAPATRAWRTAYDGRLEQVGFPHPDAPDTDVSRPAASQHAADYFVDVAAQERRFVAALEADGAGLVQTSTAALTGRKLFVWGRGAGGSRWQEWLSGPEARYCEIQAGVCPTQLEHDLLPGGSCLSWTETFGAVQAPVEGSWEEAVGSVRSAIDRVETLPALEERHRRWLADVADRAPGDRLATGSGWGRAESELRGGWTQPGLPFPEVDDASAAALGLLRTGVPEQAEELAVPPVSERWREVVDAAPAHWWTDLARGLHRELGGRPEEAAEAYERSSTARPTATAAHRLAMLALQGGDVEAGTRHLRRARELDPDDRCVATTLLALLLDEGRAQEAIETEEQLPDVLRAHGRTRLLRARALALVGRRPEARALMDDLVVPDLAEGSRDLDETWALVSPEEPLPAALDFRMVREGER